MYSSRNPAMHAMNSIAMVFFLPRYSIIRRVNNIPAHRRDTILERVYHEHIITCIQAANV